MDTFQKNLEENERVGITVNKNKTLVESYQTFLPRFIPFFIFIVVCYFTSICVECLLYEK